MRSDARKREAEEVSDLQREAEWLLTAHKNSADQGYSEEFRDGFLCAAEWVRAHAERGQTWSR